MNQHQLVEQWIKQEKPFGRCRANISYNNGTIYSYGSWPMAHILNNGVVLYRDARYSATTGQHQSIVRSAIYSYNRFVFWHIFDVVHLIHDKNLLYYENLIDKAIEKWDRAHYKHCVKIDVLELTNEYENYIRYFKLDKD